MARAAAGIAGTIGVIVLIGWLFDIVALKSVVRGFIAMQPWTALSLVFGAIALWLAASDVPWVRTASAMPAAALATAAGLALVQHATGYALGTDVWLFPRSVVSAQTYDYANPGRMSAAASIGLTTLAAALLLAPHASRRTERAAFSILTTVALATAVMAFPGYALRLEPLNAMFLRNPLALHSAIALAVLSLGTFTLRPDAGWVGMAAEHGKVGWIIAALAGIAMPLLVLGIDAATQAGSIAATASETSRRLELLLSTLTEAESSQRGYLLAGRESYLAPFAAARARLPDALAAATASLADVGQLPATSRVLRSLVDAKIAELEETIALQRAGHAAEARAVVETDRGKATMDTIRNDVDLIWREIAANAAQRSSRAWWLAAVAATGLAGIGAIIVWALVVTARKRSEVVRSLAESEARQRDLLATLSLGTFMATDLDGTVLYWAEGCERVYGWTAAEIVGGSVTGTLSVIFPVPSADIKAKLEHDGAWDGDLRHCTKDGRQLVVTAHVVLRRGSDGRPATVLASLNDVTAQRRAEAELRENRALLRSVIETTPGLIFAKDWQGRMLLANSAFERLTGKSWAELAGLTDRQFLDDPEQGKILMANDRLVMESGVTQELEEVAGEVNGQGRVWLSNKTPMRDQEGQVIGIVGVSVEITERKRAEERLRLMVNELNHRVKNTLAIVQAIALQTMQGAHPAMLQTFENRLKALAVAHDVLTREAWQEAKLNEVVEAALAAHGGTEDGRFQIVGPPLRLRPHVALTFSMAFNELATNAIKYGALSISTGTIVIRWAIEHGMIEQDTQARLRLTWTEQGGPPVAEPVGRGFGTRLIERSLARELNGTVRISFDVGGVTCAIDAPLSEVTPPMQIIPFPRVG